MRSGRRRRTRWSVAAALVLLVIAAVVSVAAAGGLRAAPEHPVVGPGVEVDQGLYRTTVLEARGRRAWVYGYDLARDRVIDERGRRVEVTLRVTNMSDEYMGLHDVFGGPSFTSGVGARWPAGVRPISALGVGRARVGWGDTMSTTLQPHRPTTVVVRYQLRAGTRVPRRLGVGLAEFEHVEDPMVDPRPYWRVATEKTSTPTQKSTPTVAAEVTVPIEWKGRS